MAKRKFNENYIQYGFTSIFDNREEKGQFVSFYKFIEAIKTETSHGKSSIKLQG